MQLISVFLRVFKGEALVKCNYDKKVLRVPAEIVGQDDLAKPDYWDKKLDNGVYVSSIGAFYCSRDELALYLHRNTPTGDEQR